MSMDFSAKSAMGAALLAWWNQLQEDRGARAELRRCRNVDEVVMTAAFQRLCSRMKPVFSGQSGWEERLAAIAGLLSHVKVVETGLSLAHQMSEGNPPVISESRFRRLLQRDRADLYPAMIRVLRMLKGKADIHEIAHAVFYWGNGVKKQWAYTYYPNVQVKKTA